MVGVTGFEPTTSATRTQRSTRLSYTPRTDTQFLSFGAYYETFLGKKQPFLFLIFTCNFLIIAPYYNGVFMERNLYVCITFSEKSHFQRLCGLC